MNIIVLKTGNLFFQCLWVLLLVCFFSCNSTVQSELSIQDSIERQIYLRGALSVYRSCYDVQEYNLDIDFDIDRKFILGSNEMKIVLLSNSPWIQIDLFGNMKVHRIAIGVDDLDYYREGNAIFVNSSQMKINELYAISIEYSGHPVEALNAPWDGGFIWSQDKLGRPWIAVACEGLGASSWWPNKDHLSDEPERMSLSFTVPDSLQAISNGQLLSSDHVSKDKTKYTWQVTYPINNYNATFYIGAYDHFKNTYTYGQHTSYDLDYYVIDYNVEKAKSHFEQVDTVLWAFEYYLGPYPFRRDGFALVEAPYAGMEHQSAIAYGNRFMRGYLGMGIPENLNVDYIILHEAGHEYWGNSVSARDHAEMWLHESFTTYMESLFVEHVYGYDKSIEYLKFQYRYILNQQPMLGPLDINFDDNDTDIYYKGSWFLHTMRQLFDREERWFRFFRDFYNQHALNFVDTEDFIREISTHLGRDMRPVVSQYLRYKGLPVLEYRVEANDDNAKNLSYRWSHVEATFDMYITLRPTGLKLYPTVDWQSEVVDNISIANLEKLKDFYLINIEITE